MRAVLESVESTAEDRPARSDCGSLVPAQSATQLARLSHIALRAMKTTNLGLQMPKAKLAAIYIERGAAELLSLLLADVATDIEVVARDLGISDASFVRFGGRWTASLVRSRFWKQ